MKFVIEEVIDLEGDLKGNVEVRARLEDGRLACISIGKGDPAGYPAAVKAYLKESSQPNEDAAS